MKKRKKNKGLFDKKRFVWLEKQERESLQKMSTEESIKITENLLNSGFLEECARIKKELGIEK